MLKQFDAAHNPTVCLQIPVTDHLLHLIIYVKITTISKIIA